MNDLKDALTRVADAGAPAPLSLEHVRGRARQIRRRRTTAAVIGSAAAIAAITGLGVTVLPSNDGHNSVPPATQTPSVTPTDGADGTDPSAVATVYPVKLDVPAEQTFNDEPQVPYWHDGQIVDTDGTTTPFPDRPFTFAKDPELPGAWTVIRAGEAHAELLRIDREGRSVTGPLPTFERALAVGLGGQLAVLTQEGRTWWLHAGGSRLKVSLDAPLEWAAIAGVLPSGGVVMQADGEFQVADTVTGQVRELRDAAAAVAAPSVPFVALGHDDGTWTAERNDGSAAWTLDWAGVNSFSPDGHYVALVGDPKDRIDGLEDWDSDHATGVIWIRDAQTLAPVAAFTAPGNGYFGSWTWDGDALLADVFDRGSGEWSLVRLSADGFTVGRATAEKGDGEQPAYVFAAH